MGDRHEIPRYDSQVQLEQTMNRPDDYEYLLALCRNEILKSEDSGSVG